MTVPHVQMRLMQLAVDEYRRTPLRLAFNGQLSSDELRLMQQGTYHGKPDFSHYSKIGEDTRPVFRAPREGEKK